MKNNMNQITIIENIKVDDTEYELAYKFVIPIPESFSELTNKRAILDSYRPLYPSLQSIEEEYITFVVRRRFPYSTNLEAVKTYLRMQYNGFVAELSGLQLSVPDYLNGLSFNGQEWI